MKSKVYTRILYCFFMAITLLFFYNGRASAENFYVIGQGPIRYIEHDNEYGQLLILSEEEIYSINAYTGEIIDSWSVTGNYVWDIKAGFPQTNIIYGVAGYGGNSTQFSLNRSNGSIERVIPPNGLGAEIQLQDPERLYAVCAEHGLDIDYVHDMVCVFNKSDLSFIEMWDCEEGPYHAIYDYTNSTILVAQGLPSAIKPGAQEYTRNEPGVFYLSKIGRYDPSRSGFLLDEYTVEGAINGLVVTNNGNIIVGLSWRAGYNIPAATFAVIDDDVSYVECDYYHILDMVYDSAQNRIFAIVWDENDELTGRCLVFDCTTEEYYTFESGVTGLCRFIYLDGKLYGTIYDDNKLYVIDVE